MTQNKKAVSRRKFFKTAGAVSAGSLLAPLISKSGVSCNLYSKSSNQIVVPTRPFGKTGVNVPILGLGGGIDMMANQLLVGQAFKMGILYWDTASTYRGGKSEEGIGKYLSKNPQDRQKLFLVTKSEGRDVKGWSKDLEMSLKRMNTPYIDLFLIHMIKSVGDLTVYQDLNEIKKWIEKIKRERKIRFFGFSTHKNMEETLMEASKLSWIDGIMMSYNYRLMHTEKMNKAVAACHQAGIGLTAMKTQAASSYGRAATIGKETEVSLKLTQKFMDKGFTIEQARLKAVWEDTRIASICSDMPNMTILMANAGAAVDQTKLTLEEKNLLQQHAKETASTYCAGCANKCESAIIAEIPIRDIMRYMMYYYSYDDRDRGKRFYQALPTNVHKQISAIDYRNAEMACPQKMPIGEIMRKASKVLA